jgi:hypothetical protein
MIGKQRSFYMEDYYCFCVICGYVLGSDVDESIQERDYWFDAILFRARPTHHCGPECSQPHNNDEKAINLLHASRTEGGPYSFYDPTVEGPLNRKYYAINNIWQDDGHPWIAVHPKCLEIATRVVDFRKATSRSIIYSDADNAPATDLVRLYRIYRARCDAQSRDYECFPYSPPFRHCLGATPVLWVRMDVVEITLWLLETRRGA